MATYRQGRLAHPGEENKEDEPVPGKLLRPNNGTQSVNWREQIARRLAAENRLPSPFLHDTPTIEWSDFFRCRLACRNERDRARLRQRMPYHTKAYELGVQVDAAPRATVQSLILADEPEEDVAARVRMSKKTIECYASGFFDVVGCLGNSEWILNQAIVPFQPDAEDESSVYTAWRFFGYFGGRKVLDTLLFKGPLPTQWRSLSEIVSALNDSGRALLIFRRVIDLAVGRQINDATTMKLLEQGNHWAAAMPGKNVPRTKEDLLIAEILERIPACEGGVLRALSGSGSC